MKYQIHFVADGQLPKCNHWALVETPQAVHFYVKRSHVTPDVLEEGWAAFAMRTTVAHRMSA